MVNVVHCKKDQYDVYIGRPSKWGNPYTIGVDGTREDVLRKYREYLIRNPALVARAKTELKGKVLGCWCSPKECHGNILQEFIMSKIVGEVDFVNKNAKTGFYSAKVAGAWYGCAKTQPPFEKGSVIEFAITERNGFKNMVMDSVTIVEAAPQNEQPSSSSKRITKDDYFRNKAESDIVQQHIRELHAARANATEITALLLNAGALKLPAVEAKKYDAVLAYVNDLTEKLYNETQQKFYGTEVVESNPAHEDE